jgi:hypothetical protein
MSLPANFPVSLDSLANPGPTTETDDAGFELDLVVSRIHTLIQALEAKVGIGASTPSAAGVLRRTTGSSTAWGQIATGDLAAAAIHTIPNAVTIAPATIASTAFGAMAGSSLVITTQGGPVLFLLSLFSMYHSTTVGSTTAQLWEGGANVANLMLGDINSTLAQHRMGYAWIAPTVATHTYEVRWNSSTGQANHGGGLFSAIEFKK